MKAIISVSDKEHIVSFADQLVKLGVEIFSTGGTYKILSKNNIPVKTVSEVTNYPEILGGRVKTLHPHIHAGILADKSNKAHMATMKDKELPLFDLVIINLYPFEQTVENESSTHDEIIENIDIGGPTMIRAAAKNYKHVGVITKTSQYEQVIDELSVSKQLSENTKKQFAQEAFKIIAEYDIAISNYFSKENASDELPSFINQSLRKVTDLRYGENPHQKAALYESLNKKERFEFKQHHGKELSYNNLLDMNAALNVVLEFDMPAAAIIKHTNPCGAATSETLFDAYHKAYEADPVSAFGSIVGLNKNVSLDLAQALSKTFIEVIVAPSFDDEAMELLKKKSFLRLITYPKCSSKNSEYVFRYLKNGVLVQTLDNRIIQQDDLNIVTSHKPTQKEVNNLLFSGAIVKHVKSNAICIAKDDVIIGVGAGQMSRVDAVRIALEKAGEKAKGAALASDAFFPFKDSVELAHKYGITSIFQPGGSKRDQESIDFCEKVGMAMVFSGKRHFLH